MDREYKYTQNERPQMPRTDAHSPKNLVTFLVETFDERRYLTSRYEIQSTDPVAAMATARAKRPYAAEIRLTQKAPTALEALARIGLKPRPFLPRCYRGRSHNWHGGEDEAEHYCVECGCVSSTHPLSTS